MVAAALMTAQAASHVRHLKADATAGAAQEVANTAAEAAETVLASITAGGETEAARPRRGSRSCLWHGWSPDTLLDRVGPHSSGDRAKVS